MANSMLIGSIRRAGGGALRYFSRSAYSYRLTSNAAVPWLPTFSLGKQLDCVFPRPFSSSSSPNLDEPDEKKEVSAQKIEEKKEFCHDWLSDDWLSDGYTPDPRFPGLTATLIGHTPLDPTRFDLDSLRDMAYELSAPEKIAGYSLIFGSTGSSTAHDSTTGSDGSCDGITSSSGHSSTADNHCSDNAPHFTSGGRS